MAHALPPPVEISNPPVYCVVQPDKRRHSFICEDEYGVLAGAVLDRKGRVLCEIVGAWDEEKGCFEYTVCGQPYEVCVDD